jgi:hypothetical protein
LYDWGGYNFLDYRETQDTWIKGYADLTLEWDEYPTEEGNSFHINKEESDNFYTYSATQTILKNGR